MNRPTDIFQGDVQREKFIIIIIIIILMAHMSYHAVTYTQDKQETL